MLCEVLNVMDPRQVEAMHLRYIAAGADVIQTNTYAANRLQLEPAGRAGEVWAINTRGARIARQAREVAGVPVWVAGTVGPVTPLPGGRHPGWGTVAEVLAEQVEALLAGGVDLFLVETQADGREAFWALKAARRLSSLPVVVHFSLTAGDRTLAGQTLRQAVGMLLRHVAREGLPPPELIGVNCGLGPEHVLRSVLSLPRHWSGGVSAAPNSGPPARVAGHLHYPGSPEAFQRLLPRFLAAGVRYLGGCCGTTPAHIAALATQLKPEATWTGERPEPARSWAVAKPPTAAAVASRELFAPDRFVVAVELDPPRGPTTDKFLADAKAVAAAGADAVNVGDSPMARVRMSALAACQLIQAETGLPAILHMTTRDRNLMALQADLISAAATGVRYVLALTGDRPREGPATAVYDLDSVGLIDLVARLNRGEDYLGNPLGATTAIRAGCALNPNAPDLALEVRRLRAKLDAGARFVMTQPVYAPTELEEALARAGPLSVPLLLGLMPLHSLKHALYLNREVPGVTVPEDVLDILERAGPDALEAGLELAEAMAERFARAVAGVYIVLSFGKVGPILRLVERLSRLGPAWRGDGR
jgi:methionine synthase I (cobalamin-dependent)/5,10-methylenetetrahydrofolate reductase